MARRIPSAACGLTRAASHSATTARALQPVLGALDSGQDLTLARIEVGLGFHFTETPVREHSQGDGVLLVLVKE